MRNRLVMILFVLLVLLAVMSVTAGLFAQGNLPPPLQTATAQGPGGPGGPPFGTPGGPPFGTPGGPGGPPFATQPVGPTAPPTGIRPTATPTVLAPGCETTFPIEVGTQITLRPGVNIRAAPSLSSAWRGNFDDNRIFTVIGGPECGDNYIWWQIRGHGLTGWVAERSTRLNFIRDFEVETTPVCQTPLVLPPGTEVELANNIRVREEPNLGGLVLTVAQTGAMATVLTDQAVCSDGYNWRFVEVEVANFVYEGWMVEGGLLGEEEVFIVPTEGSICTPPRSINIGAQGRIDYNDNLPKNLRSGPGYDEEILFTLVDGVPFEIIGGPVCSGDMNWWRVNILASQPVVGWIAEGPRPNYWFDITNDIGRFSTSTPDPTLPRPGTVTPTFTLQPTFTPSATAQP